MVYSDFINDHIRCMVSMLAVNFMLGCWLHFHSWWPMMPYTCG